MFQTFLILTPLFFFQNIYVYIVTTIKDHGFRVLFMQEHHLQWIYSHNRTKKTFKISSVKLGNQDHNILSYASKSCKERKNRYSSDAKRLAHDEIKYLIWRELHLSIPHLMWASCRNEHGLAKVLLKCPWFNTWIQFIIT